MGFHPAARHPPAPPMGEPMTDQLSLFAPITPAPTGLTLQEQFEMFCELNPHVERQLVALARELVERGHRTIGIAMLFEVLRWQYALHTIGDTFRLNNNYRSRYARRLMDRYPDLAGVFELRQLVTP